MPEDSKLQHVPQPSEAAKLPQLPPLSIDTMTQVEGVIRDPVLVPHLLLLLSPSILVLFLFLFTFLISLILVMVES